MCGDDRELWGVLSETYSRLLDEWLAALDTRCLIMPLPDWVTRDTIEPPDFSEVRAVLCPIFPIWAPPTPRRQCRFPLPGPPCRAGRHLGKSGVMGENRG